MSSISYRLLETSCRAPLHIKDSAIRVKDTKCEVRLGVAPKFPLFVCIAVHAPNLDYIGMRILLAEWIKLIAINAILSCVGQSSNGYVVHVPVWSISITWQRAPVQRPNRKARVEYVTIVDAGFYEQ